MLQLALKYHPDQNKNDKTANDKLTEINGTYEVRSRRYAAGSRRKILGDEEKKKQFDQFGPAAFNPNMGGGPEGFQGGFPGFSGFGFNMGGGGGTIIKPML